MFATKKIAAASLLVVLTINSLGCAGGHLYADNCGAILDECIFTRALDSLMVPLPARESAGCERGGCISSCDRGSCDGGSCEVALGPVGRTTARQPASHEVVYCDEAGNCELGPAPGSSASAARTARRTAGPRLIRYRPPMPPQFLPVPTEPAFSEVSPEGPVPLPGSVERNFGPQLTFPGRD